MSAYAACALPQAIPTQPLSRTTQTALDESGASVLDVATAASHRLGFPEALAAPA